MLTMAVPDVETLAVHFCTICVEFFASWHQRLLSRTTKFENLVNVGIAKGALPVHLFRHICCCIV